MFASRIRHLLLVIGLGWALPFTVQAGQTDISDMPMAVKNSVAPNFMYMLDSSGSMHNIVPEAPYAAGTIYLQCPGNKTLDGHFPDLDKADGMPSYDAVIGDKLTKIRKAGTPDFKNFGSGNDQFCFNEKALYRARLNGNANYTGSSSCTADNDACKAPDGRYLDTIYAGNYLNWYFGKPSVAPVTYNSGATLNYASGRKTGTKTRAEIAKTSLKSALDTLPLGSASIKAAVRVGLTKYNPENDGDGGELVTPLRNLTPEHLATMKSAIDGISFAGTTPLSETLADIGHYFTLGTTKPLTIHPDSSTLKKILSVDEIFKQNGNPHSLKGSLPIGCTETACPIRYWCQRSYAILLTDGRPQQDQALSANPVMCDYDNDMKMADGKSCPARFEQKTGGAAGNHPGHIGGVKHSYESHGADYLNDVAQALFEIDLRPDLSPIDKSRSKKNNLRTYTIGFADLQASEDPLLKEAAKQGGGEYYQAGDAVQLNSAFNSIVNDARSKDSGAAAVAVVNTQLTIENTAYASSYRSVEWTGDLQAFTIDSATGIPDSKPIWSAKAKLDARATPATSRKIVSFNNNTGITFQPGNVNLGGPKNTELIAYLRGDSSHPAGTNFRLRKSLLGDIINAEPVVVVYDDGVPIVFQGGNDGMLHVFNGCAKTAAACFSSGGEERWAFVPKALWPNLRDTGGGLADPDYGHRYYVDATPAVALIPAEGAPAGRLSSRLLVGGYGKGGRGYYALDVTSYSANSEADYAKKVKWEFPDGDPSTDNDIGYSYGTPLIVRTPAGWVVLVTAGHNSNSGRGKVFVLNPHTGAVMKIIDTGVGSPDNPAGLAHLAKDNNSAADAEVRFVYGGDLHGKVWRFDLRSTAVADWSAKKIAELKTGDGQTQPISTAPVIGPVEGASADKKYVYVGTGLYLGDSDVPGNPAPNSFTNIIQSMYGIIDDTSVTAPTLPSIRGTNGSNCPDKGGDGDLLCQNQGSETAGNYTGTYYSGATQKRGWYFDLPPKPSRVVTHPQLSAGGALAFTINLPSDALCDPGGKSALGNVDASTGGAIVNKNVLTGEEVVRASIRFLGYALASRPVLVTTYDAKNKRENDLDGDGKVLHGVIRLSDQTFVSPPIYEPDRKPGTTGTAAGKAKWRRIYWRELH